MSISLSLPFSSLRGYGVRSSDRRWLDMKSLNCRARSTGITSGLIRNSEQSDKRRFILICIRNDNIKKQHLDRYFPKFVIYRVFFFGF